MRTKPYEPKNRSPAMHLDWATAATEARRQRDAAVKANRTAQHHQGCQRLVATGRYLQDQESLMQVLNAR